MNIILACLLFCCSFAYACKVTLPSQLIVLGQEGYPGSHLQSENCDDSTINDLHALINNLEGRVSSSRLVGVMASQGHTLSVEPQMIQIQQLRSIVREQLPLPQGIQVKATSSVNMPNLLAIAPGDRLEVRCSQCLYGSQQALNVAVVGFDGTRKDFIAAADFKKMVRAYRVVTPLSSFSSISEHDLKEEYTEAVPHTDLVMDLNTLRFYKTNKALKPGSLLRQADLNAFSLVKAGLKTEVLLENSMVRIKTEGISRSNGAIGDIVEVYHPDKKRKYQGKVVDINKVLVEL